MRPQVPADEVEAEYRSAVAEFGASQQEFDEERLREQVVESFKARILQHTPSFLSVPADYPLRRAETVRREAGTACGGVPGCMSAGCGAPASQKPTHDSHIARDPSDPITVWRWYPGVALLTVQCLGYGADPNHHCRCTACVSMKTLHLVEHVTTGLW
jgi:hypothetical protein